MKKKKSCCEQNKNKTKQKARKYIASSQNFDIHPFRLLRGRQKKRRKKKSQREKELN